MITDLKEIEHAVLNLDRKNKALLVDTLSQSIYGEIDPETEQAWIDEVEKRKEAIKSGEAILHSRDEVLKAARNLLEK